MKSRSISNSIYTRRHRAWQVRIAFCFLLNVILSNAVTQANSAIDFNSDVLPILSRACFPCHGPDEKSRQADLRLDTRDGAFRSETPVIVHGNSGASLLYQRITSNDTETRMPPPDSKQQLTSAEVEKLRRWIDDGASWSDHWSFRPVQSHRPPQVTATELTCGPIDNFILTRLEQLKLSPSSEAASETLLRRVTLDLVGLPPTFEERTEYLSDNRPDAYERLVDRLLASPHFGERWGRHWLDAARHADSGGFEGDPPRTVWKYRDWVINAHNDDLPFDQFVIKQLAGHCLPDSNVNDRIATGFLLNSQQDGGSEPSRLDAVVDRVNTLGTVFLGLTVGCAQCHSHKFDPLSQREYYELFAFVNAADEVKLEFAAPEQIARRDALAAQVASLTTERTAYSATVPADKLKSDPGYVERTATIDLLRSRIPEFPSALVLQAAPRERVTTIFIRGEYERPGEPVNADVPHVLPSLAKGDHTPLDLARWLVSLEQPLTSRVTVNRFWQHLFGRGLVETENDFGTQGARPTHPELLDFLAVEYSQAGWSSKRLIREIVGTATYRQASIRRDDLEKIDPENRWLARQSRLRLEAEAIRDAALAVGELLSTKLGGPSVFPFQHDGIMINRATPATWTVSPGEDRYRRSVYTYYWRLTPNPQLQTFDAPDAIMSCTRRQTSNTPLQALTLLNEPTFVEASESLARHLTSANGASDEDRIERAFVTCLCRKPNPAEMQLLLQVLNAVKIRNNSAQGHSNDQQNESTLAAWTQVARIVVNLEEFIVRE
jgi:hypothetical protein